MKKLPFITFLAVLYLSIWVLLGSFFAEEINRFASSDDKEVISEFSSLNDLTPGYLGNSNNSARKVLIDAPVRSKKSGNENTFILYISANRKCGYLASSQLQSVYTEITLRDASLKTVHNKSLSISFSNWRL
jgi:hypothetical protein